VSLTATTAAGNDTETKAGFVTVSPSPPAADFAAEPTSGDAPLTVAFSDTSAPGTSSITDWSWEFGDGATSSETNPSHTYDAPGVYTVTLTVSTEDGSDCETKADYITVNAILPTADFFGRPTAGDGPVTVAFFDASTPGTSAVTGWAWDFGDGATSTEQNPSHTYTSAGAFAVSLTVTSADGNHTESKTAFVTVNPVGPTASFVVDVASGGAPLEVQFSDTSVPGTSPVTAWLWNLGDGHTSTQQNPTHVYTTPGDYTVSLIVTTDVDGDTDTQADCVAVIPVGPTAAFSVTVTEAPMTVRFADTSTPGSWVITGWQWDFGDDATSTDHHPTHTYLAPGPYTVVLTVTSSAGSDSETKTIEIEAPDGGGGCAGGAVAKGSAGGNTLLLTMAAAALLMFGRGRTTARAGLA